MSNGTVSHGARHVPMETTRSGWVSFAGYLMIVVGIFQAIAGLAALFKSSVYLATQNQLLVLDYTQWGWVHLILGVVITAAAFALFSGKLWGRVIAITLATISAIANFGFIWAYPLWSIIIIAMDIMVIYGVAMYGGSSDTE